MPYKYESRLKNRLLDLEFDTWEETAKFEREYRELEHVYRKAKAFDEILAIHNMDEEYEDTIGNYEQYIDKLVKNYMEDE